MKKTTKSVLAALLACVMLLTALPAAMAETSEASTLEINAPDAIHTYVNGYWVIDAYVSDESDAGTVVWTVADETVAKAEEDGDSEITDRIRLSGLAVGTTTLTATAASGATDSVPVTVYPAIPWQGEGTVDVIYNTYFSDRMFSFTATEDASYLLFSEGPYDVAVELLDKDGVEIDYADDENGYNFELYFETVKGETYYFYIYSYMDYDDVFSVPVTLQKAQAPSEQPEIDGVAFAEESVSLNIFDYYSVDYTAVEEITSVASDNPDVAAVHFEVGNYYLDIEALKAGTATITATTASGKTDTLSVTVNDTAKAMTVNTRYTVTSQSRNCRELYSFTAPEDGEYILRSFADSDFIDPIADLYQADFSDLSTTDDSDTDLNFYWSTTLTKGETIYIRPTAYESNVSYEMAVVMPVAATEMQGFVVTWNGDLAKTEGDTYTAYTNTNFGFGASFGVADGAVSEDYSYEITDPDGICSANEYGNIFTKPGQVTVKFTSENGLTDTITIIVIDRLEGDYNKDGVVDDTDLEVVAAIIREQSDDALAFEVNGDNKVDIFDLASIAGVTPGDVNADEKVNANDALVVLKAAVSKYDATMAEQIAGNVNLDDALNAKDALEILKKAVGKPACF